MIWLFHSTTFYLIRLCYQMPPNSILFFYADHLITLSRSKLGLQNCLNKLCSYCNRSWMLKINHKKTEIMVFQKGKNKCDDVFHIALNEMIDIIQDYTKVGTHISSSRNFTLSPEHLRQKALHPSF